MEAWCCKNEMTPALQKETANVERETSIKDIELLLVRFLSNLRSHKNDKQIMEQCKE